MPDFELHFPTTIQTPEEKHKFLFSKRKRILLLTSSLPTTSEHPNSPVEVFCLDFRKREITITMIGEVIQEIKMQDNQQARPKQFDLSIGPSFELSTRFS